MSRQTTPQLYIAGFTKCATSSLHDWLVQHPQITGGFQKELEFLYDEESYFFRPERNVHRQGLEGYAALYTSPRGYNSARCHARICPSQYSP